jgi:choline dehydrogenase-like flavoprotein
MVHDETEGRVVLDRDARPSLVYAMTSRDRDQLARGLEACARLLFAAGAHEVLIPATTPMRLVRSAEIEGLGLGRLDPRLFPLTAAHPLGTMRMGDDPRRSVVSSSGEHHQVQGLFVTDGSIFPTSLGVPPQMSVYAFALHLAQHVVAAAKR